MEGQNKQEENVHREAKIVDKKKQLPPKPVKTNHKPVPKSEPQTTKEIPKPQTAKEIPKPQQEKKLLICVEVNMGEECETINVYEGDTAKQLAEEFGN